MADEFKYRAFFSYSHADTTVAKRVHSRLEGFYIDKDLVGRSTPQGPIPEKLRPIFRDRHEFDAGRSLAQQTIPALDSSAALILLASPHAARSEAVNEELRLFKSRHPDRPVIPLIVDGEPSHPEKECFPPGLRYSVTPDGKITDIPIDVIAADLRENGDGMELALSKVVARLIGLPPDDVYRRADRERRRQARQSRRVQALIMTLLVSVILVLVGWINQAYVIEQWRWYTVTRPFMVSQVRPFVLSAAIEQALKPKDEFRECTIDKGGDLCPAMVVVPAGSFMMGSARKRVGKDDSLPVHKVTFAHPFAVSKFELTFDEWDTCIAYGSCDPTITESNGGRGLQPLSNVTWYHTQQYTSWLSRVTGKTYRLLSESEYEYAARAGTLTAYPWGDTIGKDNAACADCGSAQDHSMAAPVGSFAPNRFGLYDMVGNVDEWVEDCEHATYDGAPVNGSAWIDSGNCNRRITRGGCWICNADKLHDDYRIGWPADFRLFTLGFRVARTIAP